MPIRSHVRVVKLRKWFPPTDPLAAPIARLCILREDIAIEMQGVYQQEIAKLDGHSSAWRKIYFLRNMVRTLMEMDSAIHSLRSNSEFVSLLATQTTSVQEEFGELFKAMEAAHASIKHTRNTICGHVKHAAVQQALEGMHDSRWGFLDLDRKLGKTHYKFAAEIATEILVLGVPERERRDFIRRQLETFGKLMPVFKLVDHILSMYIRDRRLV